MALHINCLDRDYFEVHARRPQFDESLFLGDGRQVPARVQSRERRVVIRLQLFHDRHEPSAIGGLPLLVEDPRRLDQQLDVSVPDRLGVLGLLRRDGDDLLLVRLLGDEEGRVIIKRVARFHVERIDFSRANPESDDFLAQLAQLEDQRDVVAVGGEDGEPVDIRQCMGDREGIHGHPHVGRVLALEIRGIRDLDQVLAEVIANGRVQALHVLLADVPLELLDRRVNVPIGSPDPDVPVAVFLQQFADDPPDVDRQSQSADADDQVLDIDEDRHALGFLRMIHLGRLP